MPKLMQYIPRLWSNWVSLLGTVLTTLAGFTVLVGLTFEVVSDRSNPYANLVFWLLIPGLFILGLLLIPLGHLVERWRKPERQVEEETLQAAFLGAMKSPIVRRRVLFVVFATLVNVVIVAAATHEGVSYMETAQFCGTTCHVMQPQYEAYQRSAHSRVECVECHIGPGASWAVKSKIDGLKQVYAVAVDSYPRPIVGPVANLRPARDTCEQCHWPAKFHGDRVAFRTHFKDDEQNTAEVNVLVVKVGGEDPKSKAIEGIHWHVSEDLEVRYQALDDKRMTIGRVQVWKNGQLETEYLAPEGATGTPQEERTMDCVDCHNRPTHVFDGTPALALDKALEDGRLNPAIPWIKKAGLTLLAGDPPARDDAERVFREGLAALYAKEYAAAKVDPDKLDSAAAGIADVYKRNVYPDMNVTWDTYPTHLGHQGEDSDKRGCFRCHDDQHKTAEGKTLSQDCDMCHNLLEMQASPESLSEPLKALRKVAH